MASQSRNTEGAWMHVHKFCFALGLRAGYHSVHVCTLLQPVWGVEFSDNNANSKHEHNVQGSLISYSTCNSKFVTSALVHLIWLDYPWQRLSRCIKSDQVPQCIVHKFLNYQWSKKLNLLQRAPVCCQCCYQKTRILTSHMRAGCVYSTTPLLSLKAK